MREVREVNISNVEAFRLKMLQWASNETYFVLLDSNNFQHLHPSNNSYIWIAAFSANRVIDASTSSLSDVDDFSTNDRDWLFGHISYDYKNQLEALCSTNPDHILFPEFTFFQPQCVIIANEQGIRLEYLPGFQVNNLLHKIDTSLIHESAETEGIAIEASETPAQYIRKIETLQQHIHRGDIYEVNYCTAFHAKQACIEPVDVYRKLCDLAAAPMATFYKNKTNYLLCGSPERYVKKEGRRLISQPIKGTIKRNANPEIDKGLVVKLENSVKDRTENIMIVDLVRNDLSRIANPASVQVSELCKPYTFTHWHQLISTVEASIAQEVKFSDVIKHSFPMGSMTGAPKIRAMELIDGAEEVRRGIYSGTVGYITPDGDFDFNVVIRSICYQAATKYLLYIVGGAITAASDPQQEYEECLLKAKGMEKALNVNRKHA